ncbi:basic secretory protein [Dillenia turbinata]|uniref:Basic secretory protein n=1 Tax=Dillenia turbinata TaxID=194707 RepID=A0AAN8WDR0_9MAGN
MNHVWQWSGNGQAPGGLIEGFADYTRLKAGLRDGFVAELNARMRNDYSDDYFAQLLGKTSPPRISLFSGN